MVDTPEGSAENSNREIIDRSLASTRAYLDKVRARRCERRGLPVTQQAPSRNMAEFANRVFAAMDRDFGVGEPSAGWVVSVMRSTAALVCKWAALPVIPVGYCMERLFVHSESDRVPTDL